MHSRTGPAVCSPRALSAVTSASAMTSEPPTPLTTTSGPCWVGGTPPWQPVPCRSGAAPPRARRALPRPSPRSCVGCRIHGASCLSSRIAAPRWWARCPARASAERPSTPNGPGAVRAPRRPRRPPASQSAWNPQVPSGARIGTWGSGMPCAPAHASRGGVAPVVSPSAAQDVSSGRRSPRCATDGVGRRPRWTSCPRGDSV